MQVFHTAGVPPSSGSTNLANIGSTRNNRAELHSRVRQNRGTISGSATARIAGRETGAGRYDWPTDWSVMPDISAKSGRRFLIGCFGERPHGSPPKRTLQAVPPKNGCCATE